MPRAMQMPATCHSTAALGSFIVDSTQLNSCTGAVGCLLLNQVVEACSRCQQVRPQPDLAGTPPTTGYCARSVAPTAGKILRRLCWSAVCLTVTSVHACLICHARCLCLAVWFEAAFWACLGLYYADRVLWRSICSRWSAFANVLFCICRSP